MARPLPPQQPKSKRRTSPKKNIGRKKKRKAQKTILRDFLLIILESIGLSVLGIATIIVLLGYFGNRFSGTDFLGNLLPFAGGIFGLIILTALILSAWKRLRKWLQDRSPLLPLTMILLITFLFCGFVPQTLFTQTYGYYRTLVGGKEEAGRVVLAHQVYAAYRRMDTVQLSKMINRAGQFSKAIKEAATTYAIDIDLLMGLAAAESSYLPRKSTDGGHGLFQITKAPTSVTADVNKIFQAERPGMNDSRYNAFLGAATLRYYLNEMNKDLFLGLLAYNIGPANGGLRFIMQQYGATDFNTIQPYLLRLPRDYPIRVLSYALAFRIHRKAGRLLAYEEGKNAMSIQALGIPGQ